MTIGNIALQYVGKENIYLTSDPQITFFKTVYKRYTNFSIEPIIQYFKTTPDFNRRCTVNIGKNGDLLSKIYLYIELPTIKSDLDNLKFKWVNKIGLAIINFIEIDINGNIVDRHYGDWINIWNELTIGIGHKKSYNKLIGNTLELNSYTNTKNNSFLYIPLSFWFCLDTSLSLPLISLYNSDIKIHVDFNDINACYKISPSLYLQVIDNYCIYDKGELFYQIYQNNKIIGEFINFDPIKKLLYYNPKKNTFIIPINDNEQQNLKLIGSKSNYIMKININSSIVHKYYNNIPTMVTSYLLVDYIYLDNFERTQFLNNNHEYLIQVIQTLTEKTINSIYNTYKLPLFNSIKLLIWRTLLVSNKLNNNYFDYNNTYNNDLIKNNNNKLIVNNLLVFNSINRMDLNNIKYYTILQYYQNQLINNDTGIYLYSFSLNPILLQPSGSMNFSKIDDAYIQLTMNNCVNYQNPILIKAYAIQLNLFKISNGIGGLVYTI